MILVNVLQTFVGEIVHGLPLVDISRQLAEHLLVCGVALDRRASLDDDVGTAAAYEYLGWNTRVQLASVLLDLLGAGTLAQELLLRRLLLLGLLLAGKLTHERVTQAVGSHAEHARPTLATLSNTARHNGTIVAAGSLPSNAILAQAGLVLLSVGGA